MIINRLSRCISPLVNSQYIPLESFDSFVQYVDRPTSLQAKAMKVIRNRKWIHSWTMQRVHHAKNKVIAKTILHSHAKIGKLSHNVSQRLVSKVLLTSVLDVSHALIQSSAKTFWSTCKIKSLCHPHPNKLAQIYCSQNLYTEFYN